MGRKTLASSSAPVTMPVASWLKLVSSRAFWMPGEGEHREHHADDGALAAEDRHPGEQHDRDDAQLQAEAVVLHGGVQPEGSLFAARSAYGSAAAESPRFNNAQASMARAPRSRE